MLRALGSRRDERRRSPCWWTARPGERHWSLDRGLHYGDGLFETMRVHARPASASWPCTLARLALGCARLRHHAARHRAVRRRPRHWPRRWRRPSLKLLAHARRGDARGYALAARAAAARCGAVYAGRRQRPRGKVSAVHCRASRLGENPALAGIKHCNRLEQVLARGELRAHRRLRGPDVQTARASLIIGHHVQCVPRHGSGRLVTPRVDRCGVAGVCCARRGAARGGAVGMPGRGRRRVSLAALVRRYRRVPHQRAPGSCCRSSRARRSRSCRAAHAVAALAWQHP